MFTIASKPEISYVHPQKKKTLYLLYYELENIDWNYVTKFKTVDAAFIELFVMKVSKILKY